MLKNFASRVTKPLALRLGVAFILFTSFTVLFVALADEVREGETLTVDNAILLAINSHAAPLWNRFFLSITHLGDFIGIITFGVILLMILYLRKRYGDMILLTAGVGGATIINVILKSIFERSRPDLWNQLINEASFSFPSGHAMASSAFALSVIAIFWYTRYRYVALALGVSFTVCISFSRLYLGVHYPTDIVGGWIVSAVWVGIVVAVVRGFKRPLRKSRIKA
jgi:membrane-associated phospholipid phosphatase